MTKAVACKQDAIVSESDCSEAAVEKALIDSSRQFQESLKYDEAEAEKVKVADKKDDRQASVQFNTTVLGVEIPLHREYPESARKRMWMSFEEIHKNAERNINEFRADNWEWRNACEEESMMLQSVGVLVHPASYKRPKAHKRKTGKKKKFHRRKAKQYAG